MVKDMETQTGTDTRPVLFDGEYYFGHYRGENDPEAIDNDRSEEALEIYLTERCRGLTEGYVCPTCFEVWDWKMVTDPKTGNTLCPDDATDVTPVRYWV
jgi:hypothetical protein